MSIQTETGITTPPAGYVYAGRGPLLALATRGTQTRGHLALFRDWNDICPWHTDCQFNGQSEGVHYAVLLGTEAHDLLFPAAPAPAAPLAPPEGYVYVGQGPVALGTTREQPAGDLALLHASSYLDPSWEWSPSYGYNGQAVGTHYAARIGSHAQQTLRPINPQLELMNTEPTMNTEPEENEEDEVPEGEVMLPDGTTVSADECVDVVVGGWCEQYSTYNGTYYARSANFRTAPMPEDYEGVRWLERENLHALESECDIVETHDGEYAFRENCRRIDGDWYHTDEVSYDGHGDPYYTESDDYVYCEGEGETYPRDECHWCEAQDRYVYGDADECSDCNRSESEDHINEYHGSPKPQFFRNYPCSGWGIGFEVEKNEVHGASEEGEYVGSSPLFSGWERDASCGVEGITHVYDPFTCAETFKQHVEASKRWLDAACDRTCGGHINISNDRHTPRELLQAMRTYAPLWYAIYRNRLNNTYCVEDKKVEHGSTKYSPLRTKSFGVELRLPPAVRNGEQLLRRFELMSLCCKAIDEGWSLSRYVRSCKPLLFEKVYSKDRTRYAYVLRLTRKFDRWFKDGHIHIDIAQYV